MVDIFYEDGTPVPDPNAPDKQLSYHIDRKILVYLDKIKEILTKKDKDFVEIMDGYEGSGKSTFAMQKGKYVDPTLDLSRICMTADDFKEAIKNSKKGQCVIYDEAVTGLAAGESITRIGRLLKSMMMQMRQKNLYVIVILPTVFELSKYSVLARARSFFHVYESGGRQGYWVGYNRKSLKSTYLKGRKTYSYRVPSRFNGRFYGKYVVNEEEYRKKKEQALFSLDNEKKGKELSKREIRLLVQRDGLMKFIREKKLPIRELERYSKSWEFPLDKHLISETTSKLQKKYEKYRAEHGNEPEETWEVMEAAP